MITASLRQFVCLKAVPLGETHPRCGRSLRHDGRFLLTISAATLRLWEVLETPAPLLALRTSPAYSMIPMYAESSSLNMADR